MRTHRLTGIKNLVLLSSSAYVRPKTLVHQVEVSLVRQKPLLEQRDLDTPLCLGRVPKIMYCNEFQQGRAAMRRNR